jgi:hypothetical protein
MRVSEYPVEVDPGRAVALAAVDVLKGTVVVAEVDS